MKHPDVLTQIRGILEEELGEFRPFADLSAREIESVAARLTRALTPVVEARLGDDVEARRSAA